MNPTCNTNDEGAFAHDSAFTCRPSPIAHSDTYATLTDATDLGNDPSVANVVVVNAPVPGFIECERAINSGPHHFVVKAALAALDRWLVDGTAPTRAARLELDPAGNALSLDELGNALGGIRTPYVDAPIARLSGYGQGTPAEGSICFLFGTTEPFDAATLRTLYPDHASYVAAVTRSAQAAVEQGFLIREDAELITRAAAAREDVPPP